jgi:hypothetical protein
LIGRIRSARDACGAVWSDTFEREMALKGRTGRSIELAVDD